MTAESETLLSLLVQKTGQSEEEVQQKLQELTARIEEAAAGTKSSFHIEGLGTFTAGGGELKFKPSEKLETEINYRYAGMPPIELVEAFKETGSGVPVVQPSEPSESPKGDQQSDDRTAEPQETEEIEEKVKEEEAAAAPETDEGVPASFKKAEEQEADAPDTEDEKKVPKEKKKKEYALQRKNRGKGLWVAAAAIFIIVILALGWLFFSQRSSFKKEGPQQQRAAPFDSAKTQNLSEKQEKDTTQGRDLAAKKSTDLSIEKAGANEPTSSKYGLMGSQNRQIDDAYTIVIHSFRLKTTVKKIAKNLHDKGYRTVIFHGAKDEDIYWRVGVGQFKTIKDAQKAVKKLPEDYQNPQAHFIHRINH
jgi:cell division septation protein DedD